MKTLTRTTVVSLLAVVALIIGTSVAFAQETKTLKEDRKSVVRERVFRAV